jgi:hypothetical protein
LNPWYLALASFVALLQFRVILLIFGPFHRTSVEAAAGVIKGEPIWRIFQSRLLGPYIVKAVSVFFGSFKDAHVFCSVLILALSGYFVLLFLKRITSNEGKTLSGYFLFSFLVFFGFAGLWLFIWDLLDILIFVLFNYFVLRRKDYRYFSLLFVAAILNRESGFYIAIWMILDPLIRYRLAASAKGTSTQSASQRPGRADHQMLVSGLALLAIGFAFTEYVRSALLVREVGPLVAGTVKGAGARFHYMLPENLARLKIALTTLRSPLLFLIPLFWVAYATFCVRFITRNPAKHLALGAIHLLVLGSVLVFRPAFAPPVYLALLPFVALNLWTVLAGPSEPTEAELRAKPAEEGLPGKAIAEPPAEPEGEKAAEPEEEKAAEPAKELRAEPGEEKADEPDEEKADEPDEEKPDEPAREGFSAFIHSRGLLYAIVFLAAAAAVATRLCTDVDTDRKRKKKPRVAETKAAAPAAAPESQPSPPGPEPRGKIMKGPIGDEKLNELTESLSKHAGKPVWFATYTNDQTAVALQRQLEDVFQAAGWEVRANTPIRLTFKYGILLFVAESKAPRYLMDAAKALESAGVKMKVGTGYRAFAEKMKKKNPAWRGIRLAPEQTFVIVIGPQE